MAHLSAVKFFSHCYQQIFYLTTVAEKNDAKPDSPANRQKSGLHQSTVAQKLGLGI